VLALICRPDNVVSEILAELHNSGLITIYGKTRLIIMS